jgi:hypothetical protein
MRKRRILVTLSVGLGVIAATLLLITSLAAAGPPRAELVSMPAHDARVGPAPETADEGAPDAGETRAVTLDARWSKWVNNRPWNPDLVVTVETSDTIKVTDIITTLPNDSLVLVEEWDPAHLKLLDYQYEPLDSSVVRGDAKLTWEVPEGAPRVYRLTKWFHVEPCTWRSTTLYETLSTGGGQVIGQRPVTIIKTAPVLWIDSSGGRPVHPGDVVTFTLEYGNSGGYENSVMIRNEFPATAPFAWSSPSPDRVDPGRGWAEWDVGDLRGGGVGEILVAVAISEIAEPGPPIEIWDWIYDHTGEPMDNVVTAFLVEELPPVMWEKFVDGVLWQPDLVVTAETSQTIRVEEFVESVNPFSLDEYWNPEYLTLVDYSYSIGEVNQANGTIKWFVEQPLDQTVMTMTKVFHVGPGPWPWTILEEYLHVGGAQEPLVRFVPIEHRFPPVTFPGGDWPWYAQGEIFVHPEPPLVGEPTQLCAEVVNHDPANAHWVGIEFAVANFGIGLPFHPVGHAEVLVPPGGHAVGCTMWVPPTPEHWCIEVRLMSDGPPYARSQRNVDVDEPLHPDTPHARSFLVRNPFDEPATITLNMVRHVAADWILDLSPDTLPDMEPGMTRTVTLTVTPPLDLPPDGQPIVDVEARVGDELIGGFRKIFRPPVVLHPFPDPPYAEREITVHPYPPLAGEPTELCVELRNPTDEPQDVKVQFSWANFGIGLPFTPINGLRTVHLPPHSVVKECIHWIPPVSGHLCVQVELFIDGYEPQRSQRNLDVAEVLRPHVPDSVSFEVANPLEQDATIELTVVPHLPNWEFDLSPNVLRDVPPGFTRTVTLTVQPPADLPPDGQAVVDVEAFAGDILIGGFRKIFRPPVILHRFPDPWYAEREITVHPEPALAGRPTEICVDLRNPTDYPQEVVVRFSWAHFGIGLPFTPINGPIPVIVPPHSLVRRCINWIPPISGNVCLQVELDIEGYETQRSRRNIDVNEPLEPNVPHSLAFPVRNPFGDRVTVTLGLVPHFPDWGLELSQDVLRNMEPNEEREVILTVTPPADLPEDGAPIVDVEAFVKGELIGGFRKIFRPPVPVHRPRDPQYAESEIFVDPYPAIPGMPVRLGVEVFNFSDHDQVVTATFSVANFGIGLPFSTAHIAPNPVRIFVPAGGAARGHTIWGPPFWKGKFCVRVELEMENHETMWSHRNIDVGEPLRPGQPHELEFLVGSWPFDGPVTVNLGLVTHKEGWRAWLSEYELPAVQSDQPVSVTLTVVPPPDADLGSGEPIVDVEAVVDGRLIGGFRKMDIPPVPIHKPHEKGYAESEIIIDPEPPKQGELTRLATVLQNSSEETITLDLQFGWAKFGMGIPFSTTGIVPTNRTVTLGPEMTATAEVAWTPVYPGSQCVRILLSDPSGVYGDQESQRNVEVLERPPCGPRTFTFTVYNDSPFTVTVDLGMVTYDVPADWTVTTVPSDTLVLGPFSEGTVQVIVDIPCPDTVMALQTRREIATLQQGAGGVPTVDVEGYVDGVLKGGIEIQFPGYGSPWGLFLPVMTKSGF